MKIVRKYLTFSNVLASIAIFIALGGSAYAVTKNSVGSAQLKQNAVTAKKIKKNAVTAVKIKNNAVTSTKIRNGAVTGRKIATGAIDGSKLAPGAVVASAENAKRAESAGKADTAVTAENLVNQETFFLKLQAGEQKTIAQHGAVSLYAKCFDNGGTRYIYMYAKTAVDGAILEADYSYNGGTDPSDFLNTTTPEDDRVWEYENTSVTETYVDSEIDSGFVLGPDGKGLVANSEGIIMGINYAGANCLTAGVINKVG